MGQFVLKGNICYSRDKWELYTIENGYLVCNNGRSEGVYKELPEQFKNFELFDYTDKIIIPGLVDLHIHAPQYSFRGLGMDLELLNWLDTYTFPEEMKYADLEYADKAYQIFVDDFVKSATTRACIFATIHIDATLCLMKKLELSGMHTMVGKVNMDRNSPKGLCEVSVKQALEETRTWIKEAKKQFRNTHPILTPRFIPSCTDELMLGLGDIQKESGLPVQSHLSENRGEVEWVQKLNPTAKFYGDAYHQFGLFGKSCRTVMAHCVLSSEEEIELMKRNGVFIAHCPMSNANLSSGIAPVQKYLSEGIKIGLGSDVAAGESLSIFQAMTEAIKYSKLRWRLLDSSLEPLTFEEAFYMGTVGGGEFFGNVGSFEKGYEFDAVVLDDENLRSPQQLSVKSRLERIVYLSDNRNIINKFVAGVRIF